ncbi:S-layer homology domain-containing protein [Bacillus aerolatus]|nr:S-layer homology domain-containing protein [Bacillus aerolatus]
MKRYPFSNKALKAMIAATVAFTPIAAFGGGFHADQVEAAEQNLNFTDLESLVAYLQTVRKHLTDEDIQVLNEAQEKADRISAEDYVDRILKAPVSEEGRALFVATIDFITEVNLLEAKKEDIEAFAKEQSPNVEAVFESEGTSITMDQYLTYVANVEQKFLDIIQLTEIEDLSEEKHAIALTRALLSAKDPSENAVITKTILRNINQEEAPGAIKELVQKIDPNLSAAKVVVKALKKANEKPEEPTPPGNGGGGTPGPTPGDTTPTDDGVEVTPVVEANGNEVIGTIPDALIDEIVAVVTPEKDEVVINLPKVEVGQTVSLLIPAELIDKLKAKAPDADITVQGDGVSYEIEVEDVDTAALAKKLGVPVSELSLKVSVNPVPSARALEVTKAVQAKGAKVLSQIVDFSVEAVGGDKSVILRNVGNEYVKRGFGLNANVNTNRATGVRVNDDNTFSAVPTRFVTEDDKQKAVVKSLRSSVYTVIEGNVTFPDVDKGNNWAENYIESLASKYIISGKTNGKYGPDEYMTRAQFAVLLTRALGLPGADYDGRFKDVKGDEWFNVEGALMAAVKNGVVAGKKNGTFAPNDRITRAEATAMIGRALNLSFVDFDKEKFNKNKKITDFKDAKKVGASTREDVLRAYQAGIVAGTTKGNFEPTAFTKRDQMARILAEFLIKADLMSELK